MKSGKIVVAALAAVLSLTARAEAPFPLPKVPDVSIPDRCVDVTDYGARADGMKCTKAFADAIAAGCRLTFSSRRGEACMSSRFGIGRKSAKKWRRTLGRNVGS